MMTKKTESSPWHIAIRIWADRADKGSFSGYQLLRLSVRLLLITIGEFNRNSLSLRSAALTYTVLLSLVPILALSTAVIKGLGGDDQLRKTAYSYIGTLTDHNNPAIHPGMADTGSGEKAGEEQRPASLADHLLSAVNQLFDYVDKTNFATLGTIGVVGILLSALLVLASIEEAMNGIWKVASGRTLLRRIADYLTLLILFPLSINIAFAASAMLQSPALIARFELFIPFAWLQTLLLKALPVAVIILTFYVIYIFFPNTRVKSIPALLGATLAALLWTMVQNIYISLQIGVANYNAIYGSFATLPLFLVWVFLGWLFILSGAQVAFAFQNLHTYRLIPPTVAPSLQLGAALDILDCIETALGDARVITAETLASHLPQYQPTVISLTLAKLRTAELVHLSQTDNRLLPAVPRQGDNTHAVITAMLGGEAAPTSGGNRSLEAIKAAAEALHNSVQPSGSQGNRPV